MVDAETMVEDVVVTESDDISSKDAKKKEKTVDLSKVKFIKKNEETEIPGVIYLGHIPHGFYEKEMKSFFSQFGDLKRFRLARSKQTGESKGYAFIEFRYEEVAKEVAEAMNNYLMFDHILKCHVIPNEKVRPEMFMVSERCRKPIPNHVIARRKHNAKKTDSVIERYSKRMVGKLNKTNRRLSALGIEFDIDKLLPHKVTKTKTELKEEDLKKESKETENRKRTLSMSDPLLLDPSDKEITFKVPPNTATVIMTRKRKRNVQ